MNVSVVIPAHNEAASIGAVLDAICAAPVAPHVLREVIVFEDGSTDATADEVRRAAARHPAVVLVTSARRRGRAAAHNALLEHASGDVIVRFDADAIPEPAAIRELAGAVAGGAAMAFGVGVPVRRRRNAVSAGAAFAVELVGELQRSRRSEDFAPGRIYAIDARMKDSVRMPAEIINEDHFVSLAIRRAGGSVRLAQGARVHFFVPDTLSDYCAQSSRVREGQRQLERYGHRPFRLGELMPSIAGTARRNPSGAVVWALMYVLSQLWRAGDAPDVEPVIGSTKGPLGEAVEAASRGDASR